MIKSTELTLKSLLSLVLSFACAAEIAGCGRATTSSGVTPALAFSDHARRTHVCATSNDTGTEIAYTAQTPIPGEHDCGTAAGGLGGGADPGTPPDSPGDSPTNYGCFDSADLCLPVLKVAVRTPVSGASCVGSMLTLGDSWPIDSTNPKNMVTNIFGLVFTQSGGGTSVWAWLYTEPGGDTYLQENASYRSSFEGFISGIPALSAVGGALQNSHGGIVQVTSKDGQAILNNWRKQPGSKAGSCFKAPLNPANA